MSAGWSSPFAPEARISVSCVANAKEVKSRAGTGIVVSRNGCAGSATFQISSLTPEGLRVRAPEYLAGADAADPLISPVFGDLSGLPPLLIQVGSHEVLLSDALRLAARAAMSDVAVTLEVTPGVPHVFQGYAGLLDEAGAALDRAADFVKARLG